MPFDTRTSPPEPHWITDAVDDLDAVARAAPPALRRRLEAAYARIARMNGGATLTDALRRPGSTPFVPLVDAFAADLGLAGRPCAALLGRATVLLYVYVRVQDDLVDEPDTVDRASVYAAEALLSRHLALFAEATAADPEASARRAAVMARFAGVAATEVDDRDGAAQDDADLGWMGEKFLPMAVPLLGMACVAGQAHRVDALVDFVREVGTALQLLNDAFNVREDAAGGRPTPVLRWLAAAGEDPASATAMATLASHPVGDRVIAEAGRYAEAARARAQAEGWAHGAAIAERVRATVAAAPERLLRLTLGLRG
jgi:hypothetical protein